MTKRQRYDLIFSIGGACSCTSGLRDAGLQRASFPMDWLFGSDLSGRVDIICNKFDRFIDMADLEYVFSERSIKCDAYHNKFNDLTFNHDFPTGVALEKSYTLVADKYKRRISRLLGAIESAHRVCAVYLSVPGSDLNVSDSELTQCLTRLRIAFPNCEFDLLYVHCDPDMARGAIYEKLVSPGVRYLCANYGNSDVTKPSYAVCEKTVRKIFAQHLKLNLPLHTIIKLYALKLVVKFAPSHKLRVRLREKWHLK